MIGCPSILRKLAGVLILIACFRSVLAAGTNEITGKVVGVHDGDTLTLLTGNGAGGKARFKWGEYLKDYLAYGAVGMN